ncbi:hypothetical protein BWQ96_03796 [Gracilariopsis chorda]|uniref:Uncharacterized protein n=1 Tax=Gracilariopsis chorda TaxID=448386 RepID=A0A2V3IW94_9FLOR|nr:hypothetical protein BWQ96_03796 [Gracilariopsis chorda]|eukprot:PXF46402.1 hypothetical protein BWQ96_03796 [Gracilariopsis chorda]
METGLGPHSMREDYQSSNKLTQSFIEVKSSIDTQRAQKNGDMLNLVLKQFSVILSERESAVAELKADNHQLRQQATAAGIRAKRAESELWHLAAETVSLISRIEALKREDRRA